MLPAITGTTGMNGTVKIIVIANAANQNVTANV